MEDINYKKLRRDYGFGDESRVLYRLDWTWVFTIADVKSLRWIGYRHLLEQMYSKVLIGTIQKISCKDTDKWYIRGISSYTGKPSLSAVVRDVNIMMRNIDNGHVSSAELVDCRKYDIQTLCFPDKLERFNKVKELAIVRGWNLEWLPVDRGTEERTIVGMLPYIKKSIRYYESIDKREDIIHDKDDGSVATLYHIIREYQIQEQLDIMKESAFTELWDNEKGIWRCFYTACRSRYQSNLSFKPEGEKLYNMYRECILMRKITDTSLLYYPNARLWETLSVPEQRVWIKLSERLEERGLL